jgi:hypothetical protein
LKRGPAAVAGDHGAGHADGVVGREKDDQAGDLLGRLETRGVLGGEGRAKRVVAEMSAFIGVST